MSKLDELIKELCPNGINYLKIEEVANYEQPSKYIPESVKLVKMAIEMDA